MLGRSASFRPRPIDINQKLPVFVGDAQNLCPSLESPDTPELGNGKKRTRNAKPSIEPSEIEAVLEESKAHDDNAPPKKPPEVITPTFRVLIEEDSDKGEDEGGGPTNLWKRPPNYIHFVEKSPAALEKTTEYDLDSEDESFRLALNTQMKNKSLHLSEDTLETLIDTFEKEYFKQAKGFVGSAWHSDEDFRCNVCNSVETEPNNPIIFCETCDMTTHVECYGLQNTPRGSWFCTKCKSKDQLEVSCILCTERNGAFKRTKEGEWVHLACAMWLSEKENVLMPTNLKSTFVVDVSGVPREKRDLLCCICGRSHGGCVECSHSECQSTYHITCSMRMGFFSEVKKSKTSTASFKSFCKKHSVSYCEKKKESQKTKRMKEEEKIMGEEYSQLIPAATLSARNLGKVKKEVIQEVYEYWKKKRLAAGKPFIPRLQMEEVEIRHSASYKQEREYTEMRKIRQGMELARLLLDLVGKRERLKQRQMVVMQELFEQQLLLGGEPLDPPAKTKPPTGRKVGRPRKNREGEEPKGRKNAGGAVKAASLNQEIEETVKRRGRPPRRKSEPKALTDVARKRTRAGQSKEIESEESGGGRALGKAGIKRKRDDDREDLMKEPRVSKKARKSSTVESDGSSKEGKAKGREATKRVGSEPNVDKKTKKQLLSKRKAGEATSEEGEQQEAVVTEEESLPAVTTGKKRGRKPAARRGRPPSSAKAREKSEKERGEASAAEAEPVESSGVTRKGNTIQPTKRSPTSGRRTKNGEKQESGDDGEEEKEEDREASEEGEEESDEEVGRKGKKGDKRSATRGATTKERTARTRGGGVLEDAEGKEYARGVRARQDSAEENEKEEDTKVDVVSIHDSSDEASSPPTSPDSSPQWRGKDTDGPIVTKKRQTKINVFFPALLKKAEETAPASHPTSSCVMDIYESEGDELEREEEPKKRKTKRTRGSRRSIAQQRATAAAAAAAAAKRPHHPRKSR